MARTARVFSATKTKKPLDLPEVVYQATRLSSAASMLFGCAVENDPDAVNVWIDRARLLLDRVERANKTRDKARRSPRLTRSHNRTSPDTGDLS